MKIKKRLFSLFILLFCSCSICKNSVEGSWENESKILYFNEGEFFIINKSSQEVGAFIGAYEYKSPERIEMKYEGIIDLKGNYVLIEDTELNAYSDILLFEIKGNLLRTKVVGNNKIYEYKKVKKEDILKENLPFLVQ